MARRSILPVVLPLTHFGCWVGTEILSFFDHEPVDPAWGRDATPSRPRGSLLGRARCIPSDAAELASLRQSSPLQEYTVRVQESAVQLGAKAKPSRTEGCSAFRLRRSSQGFVGYSPRGEDCPSAGAHLYALRKAPRSGVASEGIPRASPADCCVRTGRFKARRAEPRRALGEAR